MTTIRNEFEPYVTLLNKKLKGRYIVHEYGIYKIQEIQFDLLNKISIIVENIKTKSIVEYPNWHRYDRLPTLEFDSDESALLYFETKEDD